MPQSASRETGKFSTDLPLSAILQLRSVGGTLLTQASLYGQLAQVEWKEEKIRLQKMLVLTLLGFACLLCAMLFVGGLAMVLSWETAYRIPVVMALITVYGLGVVMVWRHLHILSVLGSQAFAATREGLAADIALLKRNI